MIEGLALGETSPGPLLMAAAFVGLVGGSIERILGPNALFLGGAAAAKVVTFFTFLPSFPFVPIGGSQVESIHGNLKFTAPLTGITAAVVGVILNLAMIFAHHGLWPQGLEGCFDAVSAMIAVAAALTLFRFKISVMPLVQGQLRSGEGRILGQVCLVGHVHSRNAPFRSRYTAPPLGP